MSKAQIIQALAGLNRDELDEVREEICRIDGTMGPSAEEIASLNGAQAEFDRDQDFGQPWKEFISDLRQRRVRADG